MHNNVISVIIELLWTESNDTKMVYRQKEKEWTNEVVLLKPKFLFLSLYLVLNGR